MGLDKEEEQQLLIWKQRILEAYNSKIGVIGWLQQNRIPTMNFYRWRRKLVVTGDISPDIFSRSGDKRQHNIELWKKRITDANNSGLSKLQWCKQQGISLHAFQYWNLYIFGGSKKEAKIWKKRILAAYNSKSTISNWCKIHHVRVSNFLLWKSILIQSGDLPSEMRVWKHRNIVYWKSIILDAFNSSLTIKEWCKQHNICRHVFNEKKRRLMESGYIMPADLEKTHYNERTKKYWKHMVLEAYSGKLPINNWCKQHKVKYSEFLGWKAKLLKNGDISPDINRRRPNHNQDYWKTIVLEAYNSDISITDWCKQHNIELTCFSKWAKKLVNKGEISATMIEERKRHKAEYTKNNLREPVFCELPIPENKGLTDTCVNKGTAFQVGKFSLSVEEDVSGDMFNAALEALNTVMEVFGND